MIPLWCRSANVRFIDGANAVLGSSPFLYFCIALVAVPAWWPATLPYAQYISSGVIQLVALPLLGISAKKSGERHADHAREIQNLHDKHDALSRHLTGK
jgi:hypothetical protein